MSYKRLRSPMSKILAVASKLNVLIKLSEVTGVG
ncbi:MAG: hypothetical protein OJF59_000290 [Cytophagales bacterium]|nr:MAG: hypothetical protein OJF59_000290 [Cytophagales bacterium]